MFEEKFWDYGTELRQTARKVELQGFAGWAALMGIGADFYDIAAQLRLHLTALRRVLAGSLLVNIILLALLLASIGGK